MKKFRLLRNRKIRNGKVYMNGTLPVMDLPHIANKRGTSIKYIDYRPLYTFREDGYPKYADGDGVMTVIRDSQTSDLELIVRATMDIIEEVTAYPIDKPLVWTPSLITPETHFQGLSKKHFFKIQYIPVYEKEED